MSTDKVLADVGSDDYSLGEILLLVEKYSEENPDMDVYLDGDTRKIMARSKQILKYMER